MDFSFTSEQRMLRDNAKTLLARHCTTQALRNAWNAQSGSVPDAWKELAQAGMLTMTLSEEQGGLGLNEVDWILLIEECGYAGLPDPIIETLAIMVPLLALLKSDDTKKILESIARGECRAAVKFEGQTLIPHLQSADSLAIVESARVAVVTREQIKAEAEQCADRALPVGNFHGLQKKAQKIVDEKISSAEIELARLRTHLGVSAFLIGLGRRMLDMAVTYAKTRTQFDVAIGSQQAIKHHLANALLQQEFARPLVYRAAWSVAQRSKDSKLHVAMAKIHATSAANFMAKTALQVHGAIGYTTEYDLHFFMKRVWSMSTLYGVAAADRALVESHVLD